MAARRTSRLAAVVAGTCMGAMAAASGALAQDATKLGTFNQWTAWQSSDASGRICYISSDPQQMAPTNVDHGEVHFFVIHRKGLGTRNEVQALMGYNLEVGTYPEANIDGQTSPMVVDGKAAWLTNPAGTTIESVESRFVAAMKGGREMVVKATSQRGTNTSYTYSLSGVTAAMGAIDKACS